jgi:hypothetical protein
VGWMSWVSWVSRVLERTGPAQRVLAMRMLGVRAGRDETGVGERNCLLEELMVECRVWSLVVVNGVS